MQSQNNTPPSSNSPYERPEIPAHTKDMSGTNNFLFGCIGAIFAGIWGMVKAIGQSIMH